MKRDSKINTLKRNKLRYLMFVLGFLLFVYPFSFLVRLIYHIWGTRAIPDLHSVCFRMSTEWIFSGRFRLMFVLPLASALVIIAVVVSFFFGPLFCGWLCPVGSSTESLSRQVPSKLKIKPNGKISPAPIRYGFLVGFMSVPFLSMTGLAQTLGLASICCRYCAASQLQSLVTAITVDPSELVYWHSGGILSLILWLFVGGVFMMGGRGWCNFFCPLGAFSNLFHSIGSKLGFTFKIKHDASKCTDCGLCKDVCPTWAIERRSKVVGINRHVCNCCKECVSVCDQGCYRYGRA